MKTTTIKNTYYDALFFASATQNEGKPFHVTPAQFKVLLKLIHYDSSEKYITWSSENIGKHICIPSVGSVDKAIQRLKAKGYIHTFTSQVSPTVKRRTITINWDLIESIDTMYQEWLINDEASIQEVEEASLQPEETSLQVEETPLQVEEEAEEWNQKIEEIDNQEENQDDLKDMLKLVLEHNCLGYVARVPIQTMIDSGVLLTPESVINLIPFKHKRQVA